MKRINPKITSIYIVSIVYTALISILFIEDIITYYNTIINPIAWFIIFLISYYISKDFSIRVRAKKDKVQTVLIIILIYLIFFSLSGLFFGYSKTPYSHSIIGILKNIWSFLLIIIFQEYTRYVLAKNCCKSKLFYFLITVLFILVDINFYNFESNFISGESTFKYISSIILPTIAKNVLFTYLSITGGYHCTLAYRLPLIFTNIMLPIFPDLNWFISSLYELILCFVCFISINYETEKKEKKISKRFIKKNHPTKNIPFIIILLVSIGFISGFFKYMPIAVMSNSMATLINRGDTVIVEKLSKKDIKNLKENDIIEYKLDNSVIIHRIIKIEKNNNGSLKFITKGDNNKQPDNKLVKEDQIIGKIKLKIPLIGYPSVLLNELFEKTKPNVETGM